jgi:DNA repair protein RadD
MITLRPYQQQAVDALARHKRAICVAPAGSGKTIIAAECVIKRHDPITRTIWLAHTREQCEQGEDAIVSVLLSKYNDDADVEIWHTGEDDQIINIETFNNGVRYLFMVCCYNSRPDLSHADIVIVDECHWAGCAMLQEILATANPRAHVYGFTATPSREDGVDITDIIGPIAYTVERAEIQAVGGVLPAEVRVVEFGARDEFAERVDRRAATYYTNKLQWVDRKNGTQKQLKRCQYRAAVMIGVRENANRDTQIAILAAGHAQDSVIVLVDTKDHGKRLESLIDGAVFVASGTAGRSRKLDAFKSGEVRCVVCTSLLEEGFDSPIASVLILAGTGKSARKAIQTTGRVLRPYDGKSHGIIYDFCDLGHGMLTAQHWQRRKVYRKLGYRVGKV